MVEIPLVNYHARRIWDKMQRGQDITQDDMTGFILGSDLNWLANKVGIFPESPKSIFSYGPNGYYGISATKARRRRFASYSRRYRRYSNYYASRRNYKPKLYKFKYKRKKRFQSY